MSAGSLLRSRWRGQPGRLEVWYTTLTDPATGTGVWLHHELIAPTDGTAPYGHGWLALFPPAGRPVVRRFGPAAWVAPEFDGRMLGDHDGVGWDLAYTVDQEPLFTFPRWAWEREWLPAAHVVVNPAGRYTGTVHIGQTALRVTGAVGATSRIYGHGNARRWAWLHADLGDDDVLEIVAAVSTRAGLRRLPPLVFLRLRVGGVDWPSGDQLLTALRLHARLGLPQWTVWGRAGDRRIRVAVRQPAERTLAVDYRDPDGAAAECHHSERADARIALDRRGPGGWFVEREWDLAGTAHAEVGLRR